MDSSPEAAVRLTRILMDHAVQLAGLINSNVLVMVEAPPESRHRRRRRLWAANGALRDEMVSKGGLQLNEGTEELLPVKESTRDEVYYLAEDEAVVANGSPSLSEEDDPEYMEFSMSNLLFFSLEALEELRRERSKENDALRTKCGRPHATALDREELEKSLKRFRMLQAAIEAKRVETEKNGKSEGGVDGPSTVSSSASKRKTSAILTEDAPKKPRGGDSSAGDGVVCLRCKSTGHISLDCPRGEEAVKESVKNVPVVVKKEIAAATVTEPSDSKDDKTEATALPAMTTSSPKPSIEPEKPMPKKIVCHYCQQPGHKKPDCFKMKNNRMKPPLSSSGLLPIPPNVINPMTGNGLLPVPSPVGPPPGLPPISGPPLGPPPPPAEMAERARIEMRLKGLKESQGLRYSWSEAERAFLVMTQDRNMKNDRLIKINRFDQLWQL